MTSTMTHLARMVDADSGIDAGYRHKSKRVTPLDPLDPSGAVLKWYGIYPQDRLIPDEVTILARNRLTTSSIEAGGMGFVLLHRCGGEFYFLIVCTWRNSNELWETVFYRTVTRWQTSPLFHATAFTNLRFAFGS